MLRMRRFSGGNAIPEPAEPSSPSRSRLSAAAAMRPTKRSSSACSSSSAALKPAASRTAASMPLASRDVRSAARAEPVHSPRNQAAAAPGNQRVQRERPPILVRQPAERLDLLAHDHRMGGERVVAPHPPAPAAAIGEHVGQRLEVDVGRVTFSGSSGQASGRSAAAEGSVLPFMRSLPFR